MAFRHMTAAPVFFLHPQNQKMPGIPKPNHLKILNGSAKHNPDRHREDHLIPEPENGIGEPPAHLDAACAEIWNELVEIIPNGVAGDSDRISLEFLCRIIYEVRTSEKFTASHYQQYVSLAARFGLTPSDRQRVKVPEKPKASGFDNV